MSPWCKLKEEEEDEEYVGKDPKEEEDVTAMSEVLVELWNLQFLILW